MPASSSPNPLEFGERPMANITSSASIVPDLPVTMAKLLSGLFDGGDRLVAENADAPLFIGPAQTAAHIFIETAQDVVAAIDQRHLGSEPGEDAREFDGDVTAAGDDDALWKALQIEGLVRGDGMFDAGQSGKIGPPTSGDEDMLCLDKPIVGKEAHRMGVFEHGAGFYHRDAGLFLRREIGGLKPS